MCVFVSSLEAFCFHVCSNSSYIYLIIVIEKIDKLVMALWGGLRVKLSNFSIYGTL